MKKVKKILKNQKGFTLVELLAVIVILGIISAIAVPSIGGLIDNTKKDAHVANAQQMISAAKLAVASNDTKTLGLPTTNEYKISLQTLIEKGYLDQDFIDPDTKKAYEDVTNSKVIITEDPGTDSTAKSYKYKVKLIGKQKKIDGEAAAVSGVPLDKLNRDIVEKY